jgi:hypothetical protein
MGVKKYAILAAIIILLCFSIAIVYYFARANFYTGGVFGYGATAGFSGCLFLASFIPAISLMAKKGRLTKKHGLAFSMLISSGSVAAAFYSFKPGDSDVWWYGAIAGFLGCLLLVFLVMIALLVLKITK